MRYAKAPEMKVAIADVFYKMTVSQLETNSLNLENHPQCPWCHKFLTIIGETTEQRKCQMKGTLKLACRNCSHLFVYNYLVMTTEEEL